MNSESENDEICTSGELLDGGRVNSINALPEKSRKKYEAVYKSFLDWRSLNNVTSFSESVFLTYFEELSLKYKSSSLWALYSMLRSTLNINNNINIEQYTKLRALLKNKSKGYRPQKAKTFTPADINKFIAEAPDDKFLATKVALILGIMGGCRANELHALKTKHFQDLGSAVLVTVRDSKTNIVRKFTITDQFYQLYKRYVELRPPNILSTSFFLNYQNGKCTVQNIGINKFGAMGRQIAAYLKLADPELYTGRNFRRSSMIPLVDAGGDRHCGWNSPALAQGFLSDAKMDMTSEEMDAYVDEPIRIKTDLANDFFESDEQSTSSYTHNPESANEHGNHFANSTPSMHFTNCSNITKNPQNVSASNETFNFDSSTTPSLHFSNCSNITINIITKQQCDN